VRRQRGNGFSSGDLDAELVRELATGMSIGTFLAHQHNAVLVGGTGTGKTHLAIAIACACIRNGARGRFFMSLTSSTGSRPKAAPGGRVA
jgi:CRISPR/Cas system-associated endonuclease/helicase Cas3